MYYRKSDAGFLLDQEIGRQVAIVTDSESRVATPHYSTELGDARQLLEYLRDGDDEVEVCEADSGGDYKCRIDSKTRGTLNAGGETQALAICALFMSRDLHWTKFSP